MTTQKDNAWDIIGEAINKAPIYGLDDEDFADLQRDIEDLLLQKINNKE